MKMENERNVSPVSAHEFNSPKNHPAKAGGFVISWNNKLQ